MRNSKADEVTRSGEYLVAVMSAQYCWNKRVKIGSTVEFSFHCEGGVKTIPSNLRDSFPSTPDVRIALPGLLRVTPDVWQIAGSGVSIILSRLDHILLGTR